MTLYNLRTDGDQWRITKFDSDGNMESSYLVDEQACECPAGHRASCRHRQMLPMMNAHQLCNTHWFWDFDNHNAVDLSGVPKSYYDNFEPDLPAEQDTPQDTSLPPGDYTITQPNENGVAEIVSGKYRGRKINLPAPRAQPWRRI